MDVRELALIRTQPPILVNRYELVWFKTNLYLCNVNIYLTLNRTIRYDKQLNIFGLMWRIKKRYVCIIMLFVFSMHVFANRIANNETTNNTATIVSFITSIVALIGTIVTYLTFRHKLFTDTILSLSVSIILITIGIANCLEKSVVYWIGGGLAVLPIACYFFYQAKKSEEDKIIKELQELSKTKHN